MRVRGLAPFAFAAVLIAVGSSAVVLSTTRDAPGAAAPRGTPAALPSATGARTPPELSKAARLAFWRDGKLWISDLDGSLRQAVATTNDPQRVSLTRWSANGSAVSFVEDGVSLAIVRVDGRRTDVPLGSDLRSFGYRIADLRWSPDGRRVAVTLVRPADGRSDAFLADMSASAPNWRRLTQLEDLFVGDWISNDELLANTAQGAVAVVAADGLNAVRLVSGVTGTSPIVAPDGRIHFLVGRVPASRDPALPFVTASAASVWSAAPDGSDVRREASWQLSDIRLDARLADGRYLVHRGSGSGQAITGEQDLELLPSGAGLIERVRTSPDGRTAFGFALERIVRVDLAKLSRGQAAAAEGAVSVFLDTTGGSDVWFPPVQVPAGPVGQNGGPAARYAFALGGHVWQMEKGIARLLRPAALLRRSVPAPRWAPDGRHLAVLEQAGLGTSASALIAISIDPEGEQARLGSSLAAARSFGWSPDGRELAVVVDRRAISGVASDADLEVRFMDPAGSRTRAPVRGTEVAWTKGGLFVLTTLDDGSAVAIVNAEGERSAFATRMQLTADPRLERSPVQATMSALDAAADGSFLSVRLQFAETGSSRSYLAVIGPEGTPVRYQRADDLSDAAWAPQGGLLGYTLDVRTSTERAVVTSPSGDPIATVSGRFAGWSADGRWFHVTRTTGLFAYPIGGGAAVWMGPGGAPVSAAPR